MSSSEQQRAVAETRPQLVADDHAGRGPMPTAVAIAGSSRPGSRTAARSTNHVPCGNRSAIARATPIASRVLPLPPGPVIVTIRIDRERVGQARRSPSPGR